jgi:hypothetical protein
MKRADGELLELGEQLARAQPELARMLRWVYEVREIYATEVGRRGTWPEDRGMELASTPRPIVPPENMSSAKPKLAPLTYGNGRPRRLLCPANPICSRILSFKTCTRKGRDIKKMARAIQTGEWRG